MEAATLLTPEPGIPTDTRTLGDLKRNGYTNLTPEFVKDILYLEQLASSTSNPIDNWKVVEMLAPILRGEKRSINKLFFETVPDKKEALGELDKETFERVQRLLFDMAEKRKLRDIENTRQNYESAITNARNYYLNFESHVKKAGAEFDRISALQNLTPASCIGEFELAVKNPFFVFEKVAFNKAYFATRTDVVMHQKNTALGINRSINFGRIRFTLDMVNNSFYASKYENNLVATTGNYHPFIGNDGSICFGTSGDAVARILSNREYGKLFDLLAALLTTYDNGASPYVSFGAFIDQEQRGLAKRQTHKLCERGCGEIEDQCSCPHCGYCEVYGHSTSECTDHCGDCARKKEKCICNDSYCDNCAHYQTDCDCDSDSCPDCNNEH